MAHKIPAAQRARYYMARRAEQRCISCPAPARQAPDGHSLSRCERCAAAERECQRKRYLRSVAGQRCTDCPAPARQTGDGQVMSLCERCAATQRRGHQRRYLRLLAEHKCIMCKEPAMQHRDGSWYTHCARHMLQIATYDGVKAAKKAARHKAQEGTNGGQDDVWFTPGDENQS